MRESKLVHDIQIRVRAQYPTAWVRKLADRYSRGIPDLIVLWPGGDGLGCCLLVETKVKVGQTTAIQDVVHGQIRLAGGNVIIARSVEEVLNAMVNVENTGRVWEDKK